MEMLQDILVTFLKKLTRHIMIKKMFLMPAVSNCEFICDILLKQFRVKQFY